MKILFVCTGNTCRSPMAEAVLKRKLKDINRKDIKVTSCGLNTQNGLAMSVNSRNALKKLDIKSVKFKSKMITEDLIKNSNMIICMTKAHKQVLTGFKNVFTMSDFSLAGDIDDPYGFNEDVYFNTAKNIEYACEKLIEFLTK